MQFVVSKREGREGAREGARERERESQSNLLDSAKVHGVKDVFFIVSHDVGRYWFLKDLRLPTTVTITHAHTKTNGVTRTLASYTYDLPLETSSC